MKASKFIFLDQNVLLEWIYDDQNFQNHDYQIIHDTRSGTRSFVYNDLFSNQASSYKNIKSNNLFQLDQVANEWSNLDTTKHQFLQISDYPSQTPIRVDRARLYFPINYNFQNDIGFVISIWCLDALNQRKLYLSNFHFDKTQTHRSLDLASPPLNYQEKLWGKYLELEIPSPYALAQDISQTTGMSSINLPRQGGINYNLAGTNQVGIGRTSPIFIDYAKIARKSTILNRTVYTTLDAYSTTLPQVPEFENVGVSIRHSTQGDYFEISATYNGNAGEFSSWVEQQKLVGNFQYLIYKVSVFERNILTQELQFYKTDDIDDPVDFRPIIKYSTTSAVIDVELKIINQATNNYITRRASFTLMPNMVNKYGRKLTKINIENAFKPKIYNASPDNIVMQTNAIRSKTQVVNVPFPVLIDRYNVVTKNKTEDQGDDTYYGTGQLQILLYPSDNVIKIVVASEIKEGQVKPFEFPLGVNIYMTFKSNQQKVRVSLYAATEEINLAAGVLIFRITEDQFKEIVNIRSQGFDQFYIETQAQNGPTTVVYAGRFLLYNQF